jgi:hypothetical protein
MMANYNVPGLNLASIFRELARDDFFRAMDLARTFKSESPRAIATLAIADSVLSEKQNGLARSESGNMTDKLVPR